MAVEVLSRAAIFERVKAILVAKHGAQADQVIEDASFEADLAFDSLESVEFAMNVESEFEVAVPDDVLPTLATVGLAVDFIEKKLGS